MKMNNLTKYEEAKRTLEALYIEGGLEAEGMTEALYDLAGIIVSSTLKKVIDPSGKGLHLSEDGKPSDSGYNPLLVTMYNTFRKDLFRTQAIPRLENEAWAYTYNAKGDYVAEEGTTDEGKVAKQALANLYKDISGDGLDLVQEAVVKLMEVCTEYGANPGFLDMEITFSKVDRRVVDWRDPEAYGVKEVTSTPIQEVYRHVRRFIDGSRAVRLHLSKRFDYLSIDDTENENIPDFISIPKGMDYETVEEVQKTETTLERLFDYAHFSRTERRYLRMKMKGFGTLAIAYSLYGRPKEKDEEALDKERRRLKDKLKAYPRRIRAKAEKYGLALYLDMVTID